MVEIEFTKLTERKLRQIIREEVNNLNEYGRLDNDLSPADRRSIKRLRHSIQFVLFQNYWKSTVKVDRIELLLENSHDEVVESAMKSIREINDIATEALKDFGKRSDSTLIDVDFSTYEDMEPEAYANTQKLRKYQQKAKYPVQSLMRILNDKKSIDLVP